jgi:dipeptidyl-peptidase 4
MKKNLTLWLLLVVTTLLNNSVLGQKTTPKLTLEDIYKNNLYSAKGFGAIRWMKDNASYSTIENNASTNGNEIVRYEVNSGAKKTLVSAAQLTPTGASKPLGIANYI